MAFLDNEGLSRLWMHIIAKLGDKVNVEAGKGLSTNDYTTEEKEKLASLATPDWNAAEGEEGYIENRTHWVEKVSGVLYPETYAEFNEETYIWPLTARIGFAPGETYTLVLDNAQYDCVAEEVEYYGLKCVGFGNIGLLDGFEYREEYPFLVMSYYNMLSCNYTLNNLLNSLNQFLSHTQTLVYLHH